MPTANGCFEKIGRAAEFFRGTSFFIPTLSWVSKRAIMETTSNANVYIYP